MHLADGDILHWIDGTFAWLVLFLVTASEASAETFTGFAVIAVFICLMIKIARHSNDRRKAVAYSAEGRRASAGLSDDGRRASAKSFMAPLQQDQRVFQSTQSIEKRDMPTPQRRQAQVAPSYLLHIYSHKCTASDYFNVILHYHGIYRNPLGREARLLAGAIDDAVFIDAIDVLRSTTIERIARRLYFIELALGKMRCPEDLETHPIWKVADLYDIIGVEDSDSGFRVAHADKEVRQRIARIASQKKLLKQERREC